MPRLSSSIVVRLNSLVPAIALKLGAANPRVASKASEVLGSIAQYVDAGLLMQVSVCCISATSTLLVLFCAQTLTGSEGGKSCSIAAG